MAKTKLNDRQKTDSVDLDAEVFDVLGTNNGGTGLSPAQIAANPGKVPQVKSTGDGFELVPPASGSGVDLSSDQTASGKKTWADRAIFQDSIVTPYKVVTASAQPESAGSGSAREYTLQDDDFYLNVHVDTGAGLYITIPTLLHGRELHIYYADNTGGLLVRYTPDGGASYSQDSMNVTIGSSYVRAIMGIVKMSASSFEISKVVNAEDITTALSTFFEQPGNKNVVGGYPGISTLGYITDTIRHGKMLPFYAIITPTNGVNSGGVLDWTETVAIDPSLPAFEGDERCIVSVCFPGDATADVENDPSMLSIKSLTGKVINQSEVEISAEFFERTHGPIYLSIEIIK